jgi:hypothetical protein
MLRRAVERIFLVTGGALTGMIGYHEYEKSQFKLPPPLTLPTLKPQAIMQEIVRDIGEFQNKG